MTGGITIDQTTKTNLVGDSGSSEAFGDDADHNPEHGCAAIESFHFFELIQMNISSSGGLEPLVTGLSRLHGVCVIDTNCNVTLIYCQLLSFRY